MQFFKSRYYFKDYLRQSALSAGNFSPADYADKHREEIKSFAPFAQISAFSAVFKKGKKLNAESAERRRRVR
tara:strand:+ start:410 stop:625 length:216 start_codon:yes stop_codon:yes gene_type:complete